MEKGVVIHEKNYRTSERAMKKHENYEIEKNLYKYLGVELFRRFVLKIEKVRHRKDNSKNINYHLRGSDVKSMESFSGYLIYNAVCHGISLLLIVFYFAITRINRIENIVLDVTMCALGILNLYCVMLQRYLYIKIHIFIEKRASHRGIQITDKAERLSQKLHGKEYKELREEYVLVRKLMENIRDGKQCVIEECDASVLRDISKSTADVLKKSYCRNKGNKRRVSLGTAIQKMPRKPLVVSRIEQRTSMLQDIFFLLRTARYKELVYHEKQYNILFGFSVITETGDCESVYRDLIWKASRDYCEYVIEVLDIAYRKVLYPLPW